MVYFNIHRSFIFKMRRRHRHLNALTLTLSTFCISLSHFLTQSCEDRLQSYKSLQDVHYLNNFPGHSYTVQLLDELPNKEYTN